VSGEPRWNDTDSGELNNAEKNLTKFHVVHQKSHTNIPEANPELRDERPATNHFSQQGRTKCNHSSHMLCLFMDKRSAYFNFSLLAK
jgi:hypothetical protein